MENQKQQILGIFIRPATDEDSDAVTKLLFNIWTNEYQFNVRKEDFPDLKEIEKSYMQAGGRFFVAIHNDQVIGTIACEKLGDACFVLKRMFVSKAFRRRGVAQFLLDNLLAQVLFSCGHKDMCFYLSTKENEAIAAKRFYLKNGFEVVSKEDLPDNFPFFYEDDLFMMRKMKNTN
ncbi:MAG: GNAT family N-acetyltransferase [Pseudomonadota bacterium]